MKKSEMNNEMNRILLIVHTNTYFAGLAEAGKLLRRHGKYEPLFLFPLNYPTLKRDIDICLKENLPYMLGPGIILSNEAHSSHNRTKNESRSSHKSLARTFLSMTIAGMRLAVHFFLNTIPISVLHQLYLLKRKITFIRHLIRKEHISMMILPADNRYDQAAYIKAGHIEHIPSVVIPQFMAGPLEWAEYVWDQPDYNAQKITNRFVGALYPHWIYEHKGRKLIAKPANHALAYECLGIAPPLPWMLHSGFADKLALESEAVRDYCISEGLPKEQLVVTGSCTHDIITDILADSTKRKRELCTAMELSPDLPVILSALPPDSIYMGRSNYEFQNYGDLLEFWCRSLAAIKDYNIIICLHPSVSADELKFIEKWGVKIAKEPTYQLIPLCDIFVASISATIQWAIACGKPVLNYDVYQYQYTDYNNVNGVITVYTKEDYLDTLHRLTTEPEFFVEISARQSSDADAWGRLDGKSGERLIQLFDKYSGEKAK